MKDLLNARQCVFNRERDTPISMAMETLAIHYASGLRCNLVFKDVSKMLNKLWHLGLKFKIFYCKLPEPVEPLLCDFLDDCKLKVRMGNHQAPPHFPYTQECYREASWPQSIPLREHVGSSPTT